MTILLDVPAAAGWTEDETTDLVGDDARPADLVS